MEQCEHCSKCVFSLYCFDGKMLCYECYHYFKKMKKSGNTRMLNYLLHSISLTEAQDEVCNI